ncbi:cell division inhibitor SepF [Mobilisporobacter senegalensis]|uniref:Cell division protein SepF n=1 Tax=Mobilisporobacter senegalensis TaxID=1329262 RepID=A0A3N1XR57_9FIRM|nr:cell division protein SepF [Mobilisporobacter senegalensis]ROR29153.1 cell division inhibitor SepF [Mobilisporobacter senegalensis]
MASIIKNFLGFIKLGDDDDDYEDYVSEFEEKEAERLERLQAAELKKQERVERTERKYQRQELNETDEKTPISPKKERGTRMERTSTNKIIPIRKTPLGLEVCIMKPTSFDDSQDICDVLLNGRAAVVNLEGFDPGEAQRIMDFISGAVYAISGKLHQISKYIFIFSPDNVDISGDYLDLVPEEGFGVPTINKDF